MRNDVARAVGLFRLNNNHILKRLIGPSSRNPCPSHDTMQTLKMLGANVGLDESEVHSATSYYTGAFSRFCSRLIFVFLFCFMIFVVLAGMANNEGMLDYFLPSNATYLPGTRYASIRPKDFK